MSNSLNQLMQSRTSMRHATDAGTRMHSRLERATDAAILAHIKSCPGLEKYFIDNARTEVPVAGFVDGKFISRRIDRMVIDTIAKKIYILDYKTDVSRNANRIKYIYQLREYRILTQMIYPDFDIETAILWTHDWTLEKI